MMGRRLACPGDAIWPRKNCNAQLRPRPCAVISWIRRPRPRILLIGTVYPGSPEMAGVLSWRWQWWIKFLSAPEEPRPVWQIVNLVPLIYTRASGGAKTIARGTKGGRVAPKALQIPSFQRGQFPFSPFFRATNQRFQRSPV